jgi:multiple sugar transport system substrate-binding protein
MNLNDKIQQVNDLRDERGLTRRQFCRLTAQAGLSVLSSTMLSGCLAPSSTKAETVQLVYQDWRTDWFPAMAQQMLDIFHASHPNIQVYYTPDPEDLEEKMLIEMQAGSAADVFQGCCTFFPSWAQKGYLLDLRPYIEADLSKATIDDWNIAQYRSFFTKDGLQYGLPKYHGALALYYNKDIFDDYGVAYPTSSWTHDDYLEAMKRLTHDRDGDGKTDLWGSMTDISWDRLQIHVNAWGGNFVAPDDPSICRMNEPQTLAALEWIHARMWKDKVMATFLDVQNLALRDAFITGRLAMVEEGSWALKDILANADFRVGVAPFPAGPAGRVTLATTDGFGIYAGTKHPDEAWELLKFLISKEYGRAMAQANFLQPARASLIDEWIAFIRQEFPEQAKDIELAAFADGHLKGYSVTAEISSHQAAANRIAKETWHKLFTLGQGELSELKGICQQITAG